MTDRNSIYTEAFSHSNPVPAACRMGNIVVTGIINGLDPARPGEPGDLEQQCALMFRRVGEVLAAAGANTGHVVKLNVWVPDVADRAARDVLNREWVRMFPDAASRPARQTTQAVLDRGKLVQCDVMAWVD